MSVISDRHQFVAFVSGKTSPMDGQRLAKVSYKEKSGKKSVAVSIPVLRDEDVERIHNAFPVDVRKRVEDMQDSLIRSLYESGVAVISDDDISADSVIGFMDAESGSRLTAESIGAWFDSTRSILEPVICAGIAKESDKAKKLNVWRTAYCSVTSRSVPDTPVLTKLLDTLANCADDDSIAERIARKIENIVKERNTLTENL